MSFNKALIVYRKELLEVLRDKRTLFTTLLLPLLLYPLLIVGFNAIMARQTGILEEKGGTVAIADSIQNEVSRRIVEEFVKIENFTFLPYAETSQSLYESKDIQSIVTLRDSLAVDGLTHYLIGIQYDASNERGRLTYDKLKENLRNSETVIVKNQLQLAGVNPNLTEIMSIKGIDTSTSQKKMGMILGMFLPYIMIIMLLTGASTVAADLVAGEKERRTLETLMVSSVGRKEIVLGKYLTIITLGMLNLIVNLFSISFSLRYMLSQQGLEMSGAHMPIKAIFILLAAMLPLATLFAALLLSISTFSRNMKEARTYEQPIMMVSMMLAMISFLPAVELNNLMALIPIVNIALLFKAVMINDYHLSHLLITIISTLILDVFAIWGTIKLFNTESVLFRSDDDSGSIKAVKKNKQSFFNPYYGIVYFTIALIALYYIGSYIQLKDLKTGLMQTQLFIILLPPLLILRLLKMNQNQILRLKLPKWKEVVLIPFIAFPAAILVSLLAQLINEVFPFPDHYLEQLAKLFTMDTSLWMNLLLISVLPGICEEILFRGFMIRFFEKYGKVWAVVISAILFAAFHLDPFRFLPVLFLGLMLGYLTMRSGSIVNSMISHALNNGMALLITAYAGSSFIKPLLRSDDVFHYWVALPALLIFAGALWLFHRITGGKECAE